MILDRNPFNYGFVRNVNAVMERMLTGTSFPNDGVVLVLNQDVDFSFAPPGWFDILEEHLRYRMMTDHAAAIGPMMVGRTLAHQMAPITPDDLAEVMNPRDPYATQWIAALSGACVIYRSAFIRHRIETTGAFLTPAFNRLGYDDMDLALYARAHGMPFFVSRSVVVNHDDRDAPREGDGNPEGEAAMTQRWGPDWRIVASSPPLDRLPAASAATTLETNDHDDARTD